MSSDCNEEKLSGSINLEDNYISSNEMKIV